jgi:uncharacterized protein (DUF2147 family)
MRRPLFIAALASSLVAAPALAAAPVTGVWSLSQNHVKIRISSCGRAYCGRILSADKLRHNPKLKDKMNENPGLRSRPVQGLLVMTGFTGGPTEWRGGHIYNPDDGHTYQSDMTLANANMLEVKGCVLSILCKSRTLTRVR